MIGNTGRTFTLDGRDITGRVLTAALVPLDKPAFGQLPTTSPISLTMRSNDHAFDQASPVSLLYGLRLDDTPLVITQGSGQIRWSGYLSDVEGKPDGHVTLAAETRLMSRLTRAGRVDSTALLTPPEAAAKLLALYGITVDAASFARAIDTLNAAPVLCRVEPSVLSWTGTVGDILQLLASAGVCRFYVLPDGSVGCDAWTPPETYILPSATIRDRHIMQPLDITYEDATPVTGYSITYAYGVDATADRSDLLSLDFGINSAVQLFDTAATTWVGTMWAAYHARRRTVTKVSVRRDIGISIGQSGDRWIQLQSDLLGLNYYGEIVGWDDTDKRWVTLTLHTDDRLPRPT